MLFFNYYILDYKLKHYFVIMEIIWEKNEKNRLFFLRENVYA
jgi:hypothetical protein